MEEFAVNPTIARLDEDPRWELATRISISPGFCKSPRLVSFLLFVTESTLAEPARRVNEQSIGVSVFGRSSGYDSNDDNIVRAHASRLRQRLDAYFENEGCDERLRLSIPKGSYIPLFYPAPGSERDTASDSRVEPSLVAVPPISETSPATLIHDNPLRSEDPSSDRLSPPVGLSRSSSPHLWLLTLVACSLCIVATYFWTNRHLHKSAWSTPEANHELWKELLDGRQNSILVSGDSSLVVYENISGKTLSLAEYISGGYRADQSGQNEMDTHALRTIARRRLTSIVDLNIVNRISDRTELTPNHLLLRYARDLQVNDLKGSNVILIGSQEANPWVQLYSASLNFILIPDQQTKVFSVHNRSPKPGEQSDYVSAAGDPERRVYAEVALVNNPDGTGHTLIIQGTGMAGTEAAADYVLGQDELSHLLQKIPRKNGFLPNFELLLETSNLSGHAPTAKLIAMRVNGN